MSSIESYFRSLNCTSIIEGFVKNLPGTDYRIGEIFLSCVLKHGEKSATTTYRLDTHLIPKGAWKTRLDNHAERESMFLALQKSALEKAEKLKSCIDPLSAEQQMIKSFLEGPSSIENCQKLVPVLGPITIGDDSLIKVSEFVGSKLEECPDLLLFAFEQFSSEKGSPLCKAIVNHLIDKKLYQAITTCIFSEKLQQAMEEILVDWRKKVVKVFGEASSLPESIEALSITFTGKSDSIPKALIGELILVYPEHIGKDISCTEEHIAS